VYFIIYILQFIAHPVPVSPERSIINHKPFNYSNVQSDTLYWQFVSGTKNEIYTQVAVLTADCYSKYVITLIPNLVQLKLFNFGGPTSHAPENNAELVISPKKIISSMLATISVIHEKNWYVNSLCPLFPFAQWTLWRTVMIYWLFFHSFYWLKTDRTCKSFQFSTIFFVSPAPNFMLKLPVGRIFWSKCTDTTGLLISP
jgi:hypothetical protein